MTEPWTCGQRWGGRQDMAPLLIFGLAGGYLMMTVMVGIIFLKVWGSSLGEIQWELGAAYGLLWPITGTGLALLWGISRLMKWAARFGAMR